MTSMHFLFVCCLLSVVMLTIESMPCAVLLSTPTRFMRHAAAFLFPGCFSIRLDLKQIYWDPNTCLFRFIYCNKQGQNPLRMRVDHFLLMMGHSNIPQSCCFRPHVYYAIIFACFCIFHHLSELVSIVLHQQHIAWNKK